LKVKRSMFFITLFLVSITMLPLVRVNAAMIVEDAKDDVVYYQNSTLVGTGDYQNEIDFVSIEVDGSNIVIKFQGMPQDDADHDYTGFVIWDEGDFISNGTSFEYGQGENTVSTYLADETLTVIANEHEDGAIYVDRKTLVIPIPAFALIASLDNPKLFSGYAIVTSGADYYRDEINGTPSTKAFPGYTALALLGSLTVIAGIIAYKRKK